MRKLKLFFNLFYLSMFTFGGGFVIIGLIREIYVKKKGLLTEEEMLNITALAQAGPGSVAVNAAILLGHHLDGYWGILAALAGTILPPFLVISLFSIIYARLIENVYFILAMKGIQIAVAVIIINIAVDLFLAVWQINRRKTLAVIFIAVMAISVLKINIVIVIISFIILSSLLYAMEKYMKDKRIDAGKGDSQ